MVKVYEGIINADNDSPKINWSHYNNKYIKVYVEIDKEKSPKIFKWKGEELPTYSDIYNAIDEIETKEDGREFVKVADAFANGPGDEWIISLLEYMCPNERIDDIKVLLGIK